MLLLEWKLFAQKISEEKKDIVEDTHLGNLCQITTWKQNYHRRNLG